MVPTAEPVRSRLRDRPVVVRFCCHVEGAPACARNTAHCTPQSTAGTPFRGRIRPPDGLFFVPEDDFVWLAVGVAGAAPLDGPGTAFPRGDVRPETRMDCTPASGCRSAMVVVMVDRISRSCVAHAVESQRMTSAPSSMVIGRECLASSSPTTAGQSTKSSERARGSVQPSSAASEPTTSPGRGARPLAVRDGVGVEFAGPPAAGIDGAERRVAVDRAQVAVDPGGLGGLHGLRHQTPSTVVLGAVGLEARLASASSVTMVPASIRTVCAASCSGTSPNTAAVMSTCS